MRPKPRRLLRNVPITNRLGVVGQCSQLSFFLGREINVGCSPVLLEKTGSLCARDRNSALPDDPSQSQLTCGAALFGELVTDPEVFRETQDVKGWVIFYAME
jgi:hypothetical protein